MLAGIVLSNTAFIVAACCLHALGTHVLRDPQLAHSAALVFCVAPASIFFSSVYAESIFAGATFGGLLLLERGSPWSAACVLALGGGCRSNGFLAALPLLYHGAVRTATLWYSGSSRHAARAKVLFETLRTLIQAALVCMPYLIWQLVGYSRFCGRATTWRARFSQLGWISIDEVGGVNRVARGLSAGLSPTPLASGVAAQAWCNDILPDAYRHVQVA